MNFENKNSERNDLFRRTALAFIIFRYDMSFYRIIKQLYDNRMLINEIYSFLV